MEEDKNQYEDGQQEKQSLRQKIIFISLLGFGISALSFSFMQLSRHLKSPFFESDNAMSEGDSNLAKKEEDIFLLQSQDTDSDGLSDYDELYMHATSPYLEDSDSDGYSDMEEINSENDPNCPTGADCEVFQDTSYLSSADTAAPNTILPDIENTAQINAATIRQMLLDEGMPEEILEGVSDEELMKQYLTVLSGGSEEQSQVSASDKEELTNLTPLEVRTLLKEKGVDEELLNTIDDETLMKDFVETLSAIED